MNYGGALGDGFKTDEWMKRRNSPAAQGRPTTSGPARTSSYFGYQPELSEVEERELRRQQRETHQRVERIDHDNQWMMIPVFAPEMAVMATEAGGYLLGRAAAKRLANMKPLELGPIPPNGNKLQAIRGQRAHRYYREMARAKDGWDAERRIPDGQGSYKKPDLESPMRGKDPLKPEKRYVIEVKPNTPGGRRAGAKQAAQYRDLTQNKVRVLYYDPKRFIE